MKFKANSRRKAIVYEKALIQYWKKEKTFEKSVEQRPASNSFIFYDGPPFITGLPHLGTLLPSTIKDTVARYWSMRGKRVERRWGWDCHGLPAEIFVENKLGIKNKQEIGTKISVADYVKECRAAMVKTGTEWEDTIDRIGRWVEFKGAYKTMDAPYMESVWWAFKELYEKGKIYKGEKVLIYCTKDATPISKSEVAMENSYQLDTDPSVYVYFQLENSNEYLLAWTTTPWTLPANTAIAVNNKLEYSLVEHDGKQFYVASEALKRVMEDEKHRKLDYRVVKKVTGRQLVGQKYHPLFENRGTNAHRVLAADFVTTDEGTGIVHEAPAYGEDDYELAKREGVPLVSMVDENGNYTEGRWLGKNIWDVNKEIAKNLVEEDQALKVEYITHEYPHCHRCGGKLMYRAHPSWFMDINGQRQDMLAVNQTTRWVPDNLRTGRFNNIIETAPDWNLSRDRYWATPIPVWIGERVDGSEVIKVVGSYEEFEQLTGKKLNDYHLPNVMDIEFEVEGTKLQHIGKVLDCWFESGSMPFAQFHYPFENKEKFESSFPADFITEAIDQTRGWFYSLTAVNVGLFGKSPFKNLICTGFINAADGRKMSKKLGNYTDPNELMDQYSADAFRFLMMSSPLTAGENFNLKDSEVADVQRKLAMIWNMYDFFTMYASVDGWEFNGNINDPSDSLKNSLDLWIVSRLHELAAEVAENMDNYDLQAALKPVLPFIDDASNWYVRRSRRRFWKSANDTDKNDAYRTLHYALVTLAMILAPFTPFLAEELYQKLTGGESVHLLDWPESGRVNQPVIDEMGQVRKYVNEGLSLRAKAGIKVRQPLARVTVSNFGSVVDYKSILEEELNVKEALCDGNVAKAKIGNWGVEANLVTLDTKITPELEREGLAREIIRLIQAARKSAGLNVDDRIKLSLSSNQVSANQAIEEYASVISSETLVTSLSATEEYKFSETAKLAGSELKISLEKASVK